MKNSLRLIAVATSLLSALLILTAALNAQVLEKSPISGGVLAARAYRAGLLKPMSTNTLVPGGDSLSCSPAPCILPNVQASGGGQPVNEDPVAVNLKNPNQVLTGGNDYNCPNIQGFYSSNDGGSTWTRTCLPGSNGEGDPIVGYDLKNVAYAGGVQGSDVVLSSSTNNGQSWSTPVVVTTPLLGSLADKPWLEVDTNPGSPLVNSLYVSVTQFDGASDSEISVSHSRDGGKTWATVAVDTKQTYPNEVDQFSDLAIGADGAVYVSWLRCPANGATGDCGGTVSKILLSKSTDGGNTWSAPVTVSTPTLVPDNCGAFYGCLPNTGERVSNIAANAVFGKGATAKVYLCVYTWSGSQMQVEVSTSNDGGNTFGAPVRVSNSNKGDQFFQWINPAQNGGIAVTWLDRRNDSGNLKYQPMVAISTNGGASFSATHPLSSTMSNPDDDGFGGSFMGDYRCHVFNGATMYAVWEDMRTGTSQDEVGGVKFR